jgi:hypothetical protein
VLLDDRRDALPEIRRAEQQSELCEHISRCFRPVYPTEISQITFEPAPTLPESHLSVLNIGPPRNCRAFFLLDLARLATHGKAPVPTGVQKGMRSKGLRAGRIPRVSGDGRPYPSPLLYRCCQDAVGHGAPGAVRRRQRRGGPILSTHRSVTGGTSRSNWPRWPCRGNCFGKSRDGSMNCDKTRYGECQEIHGGVQSDGSGASG